MEPADDRPIPAFTATISTVGGELTYLWRDRRGELVIIASGWAEARTLQALVHPDLRPEQVSRRSHPAVTEAVGGWADGAADSLDAIAVEQRGGAFIGHAWQVLRTVRGTITYTEFAARSGNPRAVRAAATACARNAAALFVPCHRVLRSDGSLGGFRYGLQVKQALIAHEKRAG